MKPIELSDDNFSAEISEGYTLVDFWAPWCGPCRIIAPVIEELAGQYEGRVKIGKLNVDENPMIQATYRVMSIPTLILFKNGEFVESIVGAQPKRAFEAVLDKYAEPVAAKTTPEATETTITTIATTEHKEPKTAPFSA